MAFLFRSFQRLLVIVLLMLWLPSCVVDHAERIYLSLPPANQTPALLNQIPSMPYDVVADIQWMGKATNKLVNRAKDLGGDAVIVQYLGGQVLLSGTTTQQAQTGSNTFTRLAATVIKYKK